MNCEARFGVAVGRLRGTALRDGVATLGEGLGCRLEVTRS